MSYAMISQTTPFAKKAHVCIWCGEKIAIGQRYVRERSVYEREPQNHKWHLECRDAAVEYFQSGESEFCPHDNERPASAASLEYESWNCAALSQSMLALRWIA